MNACDAEENCCVYLHTNKNNGKMYVGWTSGTMEKRWSKHLTSAKRGSPYHFHRAIRKHGDSAFEHRVLISGLCKQDAKLAECYYINALMTRSPFGYNGTDGGEGGYGHVISEEGRARLRSARLGIKLSEETKKRIGSSSLGRKRTEETKKKIADSKLGDRNGFFGKKHTEESRAKMVSSRTGSKHSEETKKKIGASSIGNKRALGCKRSEATRARMSAAAKASWARRRAARDVGCGDDL